MTIKEFKEALLELEELEDALDSDDVEGHTEVMEMKKELVAKSRAHEASKSRFVKPVRREPSRAEVAKVVSKAKTQAAKTVNVVHVKTNNKKAMHTYKTLKEAKLLNKEKTSGVRNFQNRTLWIGDNLDVMRNRMNSETVDLIYLDPPFNSKRIYNAPLGSKAAKASFVDTWKMDDVKREWTELQKAAGTPEGKALYHTVVGAGYTAGPAMQAYMCFMAVRLVECYRVLKSTGSIYLHCDDTADSYLRQLMDAIFGSNNRVNTITWKRQFSNNGAKHAYGRISDTILFYAKDKALTVWNQPRMAMSAETLSWYTHTDEDGRRYRLDNLTAPKSPNADESRQFDWYGTKPSKSRVWVRSRDEMERMLADGEIVLCQDGQGKIAGWKKYLDEHEGQKVQSIWTDIQRISPTSSERTGWPTQKPLALLKRIIEASSAPGAVVFDPFCGCATAMVAAEQLERHWVGCDIDAKAADVIIERLEASADNFDTRNIDPVSGLRNGLPKIYTVKETISR